MKKLSEELKTLEFDFILENLSSEIIDKIQKELNLSDTIQITPKSITKRICSEEIKQFDKVILSMFNDDEDKAIEIILLNEKTNENLQISYSTVDKEIFAIFGMIEDKISHGKSYIFTDFKNGKMICAYYDAIALNLYLSKAKGKYFEESFITEQLGKVGINPNFEFELECTSSLDEMVEFIKNVTSYGNKYLELLFKKDKLEQLNNYSANGLEKEIQEHKLGMVIDVLGSNCIKKIEKEFELISENKSSTKTGYEKTIFNGNKQFDKLVIYDGEVIILDILNSRDESQYIKLFYDIETKQFCGICVHMNDSKGGEYYVDGDLNFGMIYSYYDKTTKEELFKFLCNNNSFDLDNDSDIATLFDFYGFEPSKEVKKEFNLSVDESIELAKKLVLNGVEYIESVLEMKQR